MIKKNKYELNVTKYEKETKEKKESKAEILDSLENFLLDIKMLGWDMKANGYNPCFP